MRRTLNLKLLIWLVVALIAAGAAVHFLHAFQMQRHTHTLLERGDTALAQKQFDQALLYYAHYLLAEPADAVALEKYVDILDQRAAGDAERNVVAAKMEQVLFARPDEHALRMRLVKNLILLRRYDDAIRQLEVLITRAGKTAERYHDLAWCQDARQKYREAATSYRAALALDPSRLAAYVLLAEELQDHLAQPDDAAAVMDDLIKANPKSASAFLSRARFRLARHEDAAADEDFAQAQKLAPTEVDVLLAVIDRTRARGELPEALRLAKQGVAAHPQASAFYRVQASLEFQAGHRDMAIAAVRAGLERLPEDTDLRLLLTDLLLDDGLAETRAVEQQLAKLRAAGASPGVCDYLQARLRAQQNNWAQALVLGERARGEVGPRSEWSARIDVLIGLAHERADDMELALTAYRRAALVEPNWTAPRVGIGAALVRLGRLDEAVTELTALRTASDLPSTYWTLYARALLERSRRTPHAGDRWDEVDDALKKADQLGGHEVEVRLLEAEALVAQGDLGKAQAVLERGKRQRPDAVAIWCALAEVMLARQHDREAEEILKEAEAKLGDRLEIRLARCQVWARAGRMENLPKIRALAVGAEAFPPAARVRLWRTLASTWQQLGNRDEARGLWRKVVAETPDDPLPRLAFFELALATGHEDEARTQLAALQQRDPADKFSRFAAAALLVHDAHGDRARLDEARKQLDDLAATVRDWSRIPRLQAEIEERLGQPIRALGSYIRALDLGDRDSEMLLHLLTLALEQRDYLRGEEAVQRYVSRGPLTPELARLAAEVAVGNQNPGLALDRARQAVTLPSRDYRDYLWLAHIEESAGTLAQAETYLREALRLAGHTPDTWIALATHLARLHRTDAIEALLPEMRRKLPGDAYPLAHARSVEALGVLERTQAAYDQALAARPDDPAIISAAANFERAAGLDDAAIPLLRKLLEPGRKLRADVVVPARRTLIMLLVERDLAAAAEKNMAEASALLAGLPGTATDERLHWFVQALTPGQRAQAVARIRNSLAVQPGSAAERALLAHVYEADGKTRPARDEYAQAVTQDPRSARYLAAFVRLLVRSEDMGDARMYFERLAALEPTSARTQALREALRAAGISVP